MTTTNKPSTSARRRLRLKLELQSTSEISHAWSRFLPNLDVLPDGAAPQASLLPQGISSLHFNSLSFSLLHLWVNGFVVVWDSLSLSLFIWRMKVKMWNEMRVSLCLSLRLCPFPFELWFSDWLIAFAYHYFITLLIFFCPCFWLYPLVLVRYN